MTLTNRVPELDAAQKRSTNPGAQPIEGTASALDRADLEGSIRGIYERFSQVAKISGDDITFQISGITTYRPSQFDEALWLSLFDPPSGSILETVPYETVGDLPSASVVNFRSAWKETDAARWNIPEFQKEAGTLRVAGALQQLAAWDPARLSGVAAVSSFEVSVRFEEKSRSYRALVAWKALSPDVLLFTLVDHIVPGVEVAYGEDRPVVSRADFEGRFEREQDPQKLLGCLVTSSDQYGPTITTNNIMLEHSSGGHSGTLRVGRHCTTSRSCVSTCQPYAAQQDCAEYGSISNILYWHKVSNSVAISSGEGYDGNPSSCGYAFGCAVKSCLLGACSGVSFGLSGYGASIQLHATGAVLSDMSLSYASNCPGAPVPPPPPCHCCETATNVVAVNLRGDDPHPLPSKEIPLSRLEESGVMHHGQNVRYLMGEWALVSYGPGTQEAGPKARIVARSSEAFSQAGIEAVADTLASGPEAKRSSQGEQTTLLVAVPSHEANSRFIHMPDLKVAGGRPPAGSGRGKVLVLADFADDHRLQKLQILTDTLGGVSPALARHLEQAISLKGSASEQHRVVVFALLSVGDSVKLESDFSYLPKCCCGGESCI